MKAAVRRSPLMSNSICSSFLSSSHPSFQQLNMTTHCKDKEGRRQIADHSPASLAPISTAFAPHTDFCITKRFLIFGISLIACSHIRTHASIHVDMLFRPMNLVIFFVFNLCSFSQSCCCFERRESKKPTTDEITADRLNHLNTPTRPSFDQWEQTPTPTPTNKYHSISSQPPSTLLFVRCVSAAPFVRSLR